MRAKSFKHWGPPPDQNDPYPPLPEPRKYPFTDLTHKRTHSLDEDAERSRQQEREYRERREDYIRRNSFHRYSRLPQELRQIIIGFNIDDELWFKATTRNILDYTNYTNVHYFHGKWKTKLSLRFLPDICFASYQAYIDAVPMYIRKFSWTVDKFEGNRYMNEFLGAMFTMDEGYKAVRELNFVSPWFKGVDVYEPNIDLVLMKRCTGLKRVSFTLRMDNIFLCPDHRIRASQQGRHVVDLAQVIEFYELDNLFESRALKHISFHVGLSDSWETYGGGNGDEVNRAPLEELAEWVKNEFLARNRQTVSIEISWWQSRWSA